MQVGLARSRSARPPRTGSPRTSPGSLNAAKIDLAAAKVDAAARRGPRSRSWRTGRSRRPERSRCSRRRSRPATPPRRSWSDAACARWSTRRRSRPGSTRRSPRTPGPCEQFRGGKEGALNARPRSGDEEVRWLGQPEGRPRAAPPAPVWVLIRQPVRVDRRAPKRYPWWQLILLGLVAMVEALFRPLGRMWRSDDPLDTYGLAHFGSVAGDAMVAIALAGSVFFEHPARRGRGQGRRRTSRSRSRRSRSRARSWCRCSTARGPGARSRSARRSAGPWSACTRRPGSARCCCSRPRSCCWSCRRSTRSRRTGSPSRTRDRTRGSCARTRASAGSPRAGRCSRPGPAFGLLKLGGAEAVLYGAAVAYGDRGAAEPPTAASARAGRAGRGLQARRDPAAHRAGDRRGRAPRRERVPAVRARVRAPAQRRADVVVRGPRGRGDGGRVPGRPDRAAAAGQPAGGGRRHRVPHRGRGRRDALVLRVRAGGADRCSPSSWGRRPSSGGSRSRP